MNKIYGKVIKETEKAIQIEVETSRMDKLSNEHNSTAALWFPKSQVEINGTEIYISDWILKSKNAEIKGGYGIDYSNKEVENSFKKAFSFGK